MVVDGDWIVLEDGVAYYAHGGTIGIYESEEDGVVATQGWDGTLTTSSVSTSIPAEHRREIAEYAIGLWKKWGNVE